MNKDDEVRKARTSIRKSANLKQPLASSKYVLTHPTGLAILFVKRESED